MALATCSNMVKKQNNAESFSQGKTWPLVLPCLVGQGRANSPALLLSKNKVSIPLSREYNYTIYTKKMNNFNNSII